MLCSEATLVKLDWDAGHAVTLHCRAWTCPICQPRRQAQLTGLGISGQPDMFITLTVNPAVGSSPEERADLLLDAWHTVHRRACKLYHYKSIPYMYAFEATKRGEPHLHILARCRWLGQGWLSQQMQDLIGSPICDVRRIKSTRKAAAYVAKYCGKEPHRFGAHKRYHRTKDWELDTWEKPEPPIFLHGIWDIATQTLNELEAAWTAAGWETWVTRGHLWGDANAPPW